MRDKVSLQSLAQQWEFDGERDLLIETARALGLEWLDSDDVTVEPSAMEGFPLKLIHRHEVFPLDRTDQFLRLAVSNPFDFNAFDSVASALELEVRPVVATSEVVRRLIKKYLGVGAETVDGLIALQRQQSGDIEMLE
ncbi:MAG: type II/IV secretion system protein, partial [bacterium]